MDECLPFILFGLLLTWMRHKFAFRMPAAGDCGIHQGGGPSSHIVKTLISLPKISWMSDCLAWSHFWVLAWIAANIDVIWCTWRHPGGPACVKMWCSCFKLHLMLAHVNVSFLSAGLSCSLDCCWHGVPTLGVLAPVRCAIPCGGGGLPHADWRFKNTSHYSLPLHTSALLDCC